MKEREDNLHLKVSKKILEAGIQLLMEELVFSIHLLTHSTKMCWIGNSLVVQCQDSALSLLRAWVQSLISELKSHKLCRMATKKKKKKKTPKTVLYSVHPMCQAQACSNTRTDEVPVLMEFAFWQWGKDNNQVVTQTDSSGSSKWHEEHKQDTVMKCDERLVQSGTKEDLWESMTYELRFEEEGASL